MSHRKMTFRRLFKILTTKPHSQRAAIRRRRLWIAVIMRLVMVLAFILIIVLLVTGVKSCVRHSRNKAAKVAAEKEAEANSGDATVGFTGCMILHSPILDRYKEDNGTYDFTDVYQYVKKNYEKPDLMACEMEGSIGNEEIGISGHPLFRYPDTFPSTLASAGIDVQMLATNHIYDGKTDGLRNTLMTYNDEEITYAGIRDDKDDKRYIIEQVGPLKIGIVNYTYGTPERFNALQVESDDAELINMLKETDPVDFYPEVEKQVKAMKKAGADYIFYMIHWGAEYEFEPSADQTAIAQKLCDIGVDAIIGGHPHVEQPIDVLTSEDGSHKMFVIYSIGNALSNQRKGNVMDTSHCEDGAILTFKLHKDKKGKVTIKDIGLTPTWVSRIEKGGTTTATTTTDDEETTDVDVNEVNGEEGDAEKSYDYAILPLDDIDKLEKKTGIKGISEDAKASYERTMKILGDGLEKARKELVTK